MTVAKTNRPFSMLEKVAATRAVMSVLKRVQEAKPEASPSQVWKATRLALSAKLSKLSEKQDKGVQMTDAQLKTIEALDCADTMLLSFGAIYGDDELTRALEPEEIAELKAMAEKRKAAAKTSSDKRKAAKAKPAAANGKAGEQLALA